MRYKVGNRVIGIADGVTGKDIRGLKGTVIVAHCDDEICIEFDKDINGHDCAGAGKMGHCWWVNGLTQVKKCSEFASKIVITSDGTETLAKCYENGKVVAIATAKCSSEDEFNFNIGAELAFERLIKYTAKKAEYYNGKVVCVETGFGASYPIECFTVGKIYTVVDGFIKADGGYQTERYETLERLCSGVGYKFIPLVEEKKGE